MHVLHVVGARPNFMKAAPVLRALALQAGVRQTLVHTGQHYDFNMSEVFFKQLEMPAPDINLQVGSGSHAQQTAEIISRFEPVLLERKPDLVLVYGDVNSTVSAALVCAKLLVDVGHVEAGLRSFDRTMPEEVNRLVTDQLSELLFTPSSDGNDNLAREGIAPEKVHLVGNVMIDTLVRMLPVARERVPPEFPDGYVLVTLHRPSNVDDLQWLGEMFQALREMASERPIIFPVHPRTRAKIAASGIQTGNVQILDPLPYIEFLGSQTRAALVITDSGGVQEETTYLGIPCITVRQNTERPVTVSLGTNHLVGRDIAAMRSTARQILNSLQPRKATPPFWDGCAGERIAKIIVGR